MMRTFQKLSLFIPLMFSAMVEAKEIKMEDFYLSLQAGASFSLETNMDVETGPNTNTDWDPAPEGYNSDLDTSAMWGGSLGYVVNPLVSAEIEVTTRNGFEYKKEQTGAYPKTRYLDVENVSVMAVATLQGNGLPRPFSYQMRSVLLDPFIRLGIGAAFNEVTDFHSVHSNGQVTATMSNNTVTSFAFEAGAGLNIHTTDNVMISLGYRFFDAGNFKSEDEINDVNPPLNIPAWEGQLKANEVYAAVNFYL